MSMPSLAVQPSAQRSGVLPAFADGFGLLLSTPMLPSNSDRSPSYSLVASSGTPSPICPGLLSSGTSNLGDEPDFDGDVWTLDEDVGVEKKEPGDEEVILLEGHGESASGEDDILLEGHGESDFGEGLEAHGESASGEDDILLEGHVESDFGEGDILGEDHGKADFGEGDTVGRHHGEADFGEGDILEGHGESGFGEGGEPRHTRRRLRGPLAQPAQGASLKPAVAHANASKKRFVDAEAGGARLTGVAASAVRVKFENSHLAAS
jgi:hypothetical protein